VPELSRPDGARIHYEVQGGVGPTIVLATYWSWGPEIYREMLSDLASDHRVVTYHLRGTGESSREGPYDMETDIGDLEAVLEAAGPPALVLSTADSANRSAKLAARRPELVSALVSFGTAPFARAAFEGEEGMVTSDEVINAFTEVLENNYRGGLRNLLEATNPQSSEEELRERVHRQAEFFPGPAAVARFKDWVDDDPREAAREVGERLWIFAAPGVAGPWLPPTDVLRRLTAQNLPQAHVVELEEGSGPISQPRESADAVRGISTEVAAGAAPGRK
jgi:pimeloyl-ACP methyl ester carboxylesterase